MRSTEVGRGRLKVAGVFGAFFGRPDGFGSSDFDQNVYVWMLYQTIWVSRSHSKIIQSCLAEKGSNVSPRNARIDLNRFSPRVARDGMNTVSFIARRLEGVGS